MVDSGVASYRLLKPNYCLTPLSKWSSTRWLRAKWKFIGLFITMGRNKSARILGIGAYGGVLQSTYYVPPKRMTTLNGQNCMEVCLQQPVGKHAYQQYFLGLGTPFTSIGSSSAENQSKGPCSGYFHSFFSQLKLSPYRTFKICLYGAQTVFNRTFHIALPMEKIVLQPQHI